MIGRIVERSTDNGRTWEPTGYHPRSPLAAILGNLYRWRPEAEQ